MRGFRRLAGGSGRQDGAALKVVRAEGHPYGFSVCARPGVDLGAGKDGGEIERNHRHPGVAGSPVVKGLHRHHRRYGLPEGDRRQDHPATIRLRAAGQKQPAGFGRGD